MWGGPGQGFDEWGNPLPPPVGQGWGQDQGGWGPQYGGGLGQPPQTGWEQQPPMGGGWGNEPTHQGGWNPPQQGGGWNEPQHNSGWGQQPGGWPNQQGGFGQQHQDYPGGGCIGMNAHLLEWFQQSNIPPIIQVKQRGDRGGEGMGHSDNDLFGGWLEQQKRHQNYQIYNPGTDIGGFMNQQVTFLEPSPIQQKLNQLRARGQVFRDTDFPPNQQSLTGEWGHVSDWSNISWKPISGIIQNPKLFDDKIQPDDIKQGALGDCYLLAALAALAEEPSRILNLFLTQQQNGQKYYACKILYKGKWKTIDMDEFIPCTGNSPAFSKAVGPQMWVVLLQKAWAKLYSSYKRIEAGYPEEGLHDLTGAHIQAYRTKAADFNPEEFWRYLKQGSQKNWSVIASSQPGSDTNTSTTGVVLGHAYTVLSAIELNTGGGSVRLVKIRNPWGKTQGKTAWNDSDSRWNSISHAEKQRIGFNPNANDGTFFIEYDIFIKQFRMVTSAQVNDNASYIYFTQKSEPRKRGSYFKVQILQEGEYSLQINQMPERVFEDKLQDQHQYMMATILIGRIVGPYQVQWFEGSQSNFRTLFKKHRLPPGQYIVYGKIRFEAKWERDYEVTLAIYGDRPCRISAASPQQANMFKERLYAGRMMGNNPKQSRQGVFYNQQVMKEGYIYASCVNQSSSPATFNLSVNQNSNPSVHIKKKFKGQSNISQQVPPGGFFTVLSRVHNFKTTTSGMGQLSVN